MLNGLLNEEGTYQGDTPWQRVTVPLSSMAESDGGTAAHMVSPRQELSQDVNKIEYFRRNLSNSDLGWNCGCWRKDT